MTHKAPGPAVPESIVLATDLSARCDRALDRSAQLAAQWGARLVALNVLDPVALPDQALAWASGASDDELMHMARQELARDLAGLDVQAQPRIVRSSDPATAIAQAAKAIRAGLVVTGVARNEPLGRFLLGSTVEQLARVLQPPLLVVRNRARRPYRRVLVATDFSAASLQALHTSACLFAGADLGVYHAHEAPLSGLAEVDARDAGLLAARQRCAAFVADSGLSATLRLQTVVERGAVASALPRHVREHQIDLVAVGAKGGGSLRDLLLGNTVAELLQWLPCDTLLVRELATDSPG